MAFMSVWVCQLLFCAKFINKNGYCVAVMLPSDGSVDIIRVKLTGYLAFLEYLPWGLSSINRILFS
jgi:hypothetical protein